MLTKKLYKEGRQCFSPPYIVFLVNIVSPPYTGFFVNIVSPPYTGFFGQYCLPSLHSFFCQHCLPSLYSFFVNIVSLTKNCIRREDNVDQKKL
jgi:hypothetical protein